MLKQLTFKQAVQHKTAVLKVASAAGAEGRAPLLGVFWDEVVRLRSFGLFVEALMLLCFVRSCRRAWEDKSGKLHTFSPGVEAGATTDASLREAKSAYDLAFPGARLLQLACVSLRLLCLCFAFRLPRRRCAATERAPAGRQARSGPGLKQRRSGRARPPRAAERGPRAKAKAQVGSPKAFAFIAKRRGTGRASAQRSRRASHQCPGRQRIPLLER